MSENENLIMVERHVHAEPALVYQYLTNSTGLREWFADTVTTHVRPGGHFYVAWNDGYYAAGSFQKLQENEQVAYTWHGSNEPAATHVDIHLDATNGGTTVKVKHTGLGEGEAWSKAATEFQKGWEYSLNNLASIFDTGEDLRFTRRPMLGIMVGEFGKEIAKEMGVPVPEGVRLDDVLPDMGAGAAGLQKDDVVVAIDDQTITDYASLGAALGGHMAGETVRVAYYRGPEKREIDMLLSGRPLPDMPNTQLELAALVQQQHMDVEKRLDNFLNEISEEEGAFRPGDGEWSVKDTLAHLIHGERGFQQWIGNLVAGHTPQWDDWGGNQQFLNDATLATYPTVIDLNNALKLAHRETKALIEQLPDEFLKRKNSFWQIAYSFADASYSHEDAHMEQMQAAVAAARAK